TRTRRRLLRDLCHTDSRQEEGCATGREGDSTRIRVANRHSSRTPGNGHEPPPDLGYRDLWAALDVKTQRSASPAKLLGDATECRVLSQPASLPAIDLEEGGVDESMASNRPDAGTHCPDARGRRRGYRRAPAVGLFNLAGSHRNGTK